MTIDRIGQAEDPIGQLSLTIRSAADQAGINFDYLFKQAKIESGLNPEARARTSSATGLFQFTRDTWLKVVAQHGEAAGLGAESTALRSGLATATDRQRILDLRTNPELSARLAAHHALDNARALAAQGISQSGPTELYLAHFLGSAGAAKFLNGMKSNPNGPAAPLLPEAAQSNRTIFFKDGAPASFIDIYQRFSRKFDGEGAATPSSIALAKAVIKTDIVKKSDLSADTLIARLKPQEPLFARQSSLKTLTPSPKDAIGSESKYNTHILADESGSEPVRADEVTSTNQESAPIYQPRRAVSSNKQVPTANMAPSYQMPSFEGDAPVSVDSLAKFLDAASKWSPDPGVLQEQAQHGVTSRNAFEGLRT